MFKMDKVDQRLISMLRSNARTPVVLLAKQLGVSRATVQNRMRRLEDSGVILAYTVTLKPSAEVNPIKAFMSIAVEGKKAERVIKGLLGFPEVTAVHYTNGRWDLVADIRTDTIAAFNGLLGNVRLIDGVVATETSLLLDSLKQ